MRKLTWLENSLLKGKNTRPSQLIETNINSLHVETDALHFHIIPHYCDGIITVAQSLMARSVQRSPRSWRIGIASEMVNSCFRFVLYLRSSKYACRSGLLWKRSLSFQGRNSRLSRTIYLLGWLCLTWCSNERIQCAWSTFNNRMLLPTGKCMQIHFGIWKSLPLWYW